MQNSQKTSPANFMALSPFLFFVVIFIGAGLYFDFQDVAQPFYQLKAQYAILIAIGFAFIVHQRSFRENLSSLINGCLNSSVLQMCAIFSLAGTFATTSAAIGGVESISNLCFNLIPVQYLAAGVFVFAALLSTSMGTSVGTIAAIAPLASVLAIKMGLPLLLVLGALCGGALFGDNLSYISDTTVAATKSQRVAMSDKFKTNIFIALPAAIITIILLILSSNAPEMIQASDQSYQLIHLAPFAIVLILAFAGLDVLLVLAIGTLIAGLIGMMTTDFSFGDFGGSIWQGLIANIDLTLLVFFTGGLGEMVKDSGGLAYLRDKIFGKVKGQQSAYFGILSAVFLSTLATANNTIAIVINGDLARSVSEKFGLIPKLTASVLDIFSCVAIAFLPYGAILLAIAAGSTQEISPIEVIPFVWYPALLGIFGVVAILRPRMFGIREK